MKKITLVTILPIFATFITNIAGAQSYYSETTPSIISVQSSNTATFKINSVTAMPIYPQTSVSEGIKCNKLQKNDTYIYTCNFTKPTLNGVLDAYIEVDYQENKEPAAKCTFMYTAQANGKTAVGQGTPCIENPRFSAYLNPTAIVTNSAKYDMYFGYSSGVYLKKAYKSIHIDHDTQKGGGNFNILYAYFYPFNNFGSYIYNHATDTPYSKQNPFQCSDANGNHWIECNAPTVNGQSIAMSGGLMVVQFTDENGDYQICKFLAFNDASGLKGTPCLNNQVFGVYQNGSNSDTLNIGYISNPKFNPPVVDDILTANGIK